MAIFTIKTFLRDAFDLSNPYVVAYLNAFDKINFRKYKSSKATFEHWK